MIQQQQAGAISFPAYPNTMIQNTNYNYPIPACPPQFNAASSMANAWPMAAAAAAFGYNFEHDPTGLYSHQPHQMTSASMGVEMDSTSTAPTVTLGIPLPASMIGKTVSGLSHNASGSGDDADLPSLASLDEQSRKPGQNRKNVDSGIGEQSKTGVAERGDKAEIERKSVKKEEVGSNFERHWILNMEFEKFYRQSLPF